MQIILRVCEGFAHQEIHIPRSSCVAVGLSSCLQFAKVGLVLRLAELGYILGLFFPRGKALPPEITNKSGWRPP